MIPNSFRFLPLVLLLALPGCKRAPKAEGQAAAAAAPTPVEAAEPPANLPEKVSFNEHIQPILSEYCYHCHGPDAKTRRPDEAPLRLDRPEDAFLVRADGHPVILKGKPAESALVKRMRTHDEDLIMPPPESHKQMKPEEIALIERWIEQGAEYEPHWSFAPVKRPEVPKAGEGWAIQPVDHFIVEKLD
ncbi:MAG TPA: c-type cytochrome domain-containing protein, partial [Luteolibacter sp.]|nr:c-type cytochrome domain-containing protein [Luteolibacter sp.]